MATVSDEIHVFNLLNKCLRDLHSKIHDIYDKKCFFSFEKYDDSE